MLPVRVWLLVATIAACGDNDAEVAYRGGSRLALDWLVADDGTRVPGSTIHDLVRNEICYPQSWSDGVMRCANLPGFVAYSDAACTQRVVLGGADTPGALAGEHRPGACGVVGMYEIGAVVAAQSWYFPTHTGCEGPFSAGDPMHAIGAAADPGVFAKLDVVDPAGGDRLRQTYFTSHDGLRMPNTIVDSELATTCYAQGSVCVPGSTTSAVYSDAHCTQRVLATYDDPCSHDATYYDEVDSTCPDRHRYYKLGATIAPAQIYALDSSTMACTQMPAAANAHYHTVGDEVAPATLARAVAVAGGRRLEPTYTAGNGVAVRTGSFYDSQLQIDCSFGAATDGMTRCLPHDASFGVYYSDAACTTPINIASVARPKAGCGSPAPAPAYAVQYTGHGAAVGSVGAPYHGAVYNGSVGNCAAQTFTNNDIYLVTDLIAPESFIAATMTIGP